MLFRKGDALQALGQVRAIAFDKTGTLTEGRPALTGLTLAPGQDEASVLKAAAAVATLSEHPVSRAIAEAARARGLELPEATAFRSITGQGVEAEVGGVHVRVGAARFLRADAVALGALQESADGFAAEGRTPLFVAMGGEAVAALAVSDPVKPSARGAIAALHAMGLKTVMITGDNRRTAEAVAGPLGIDRVEAEVSPEGKALAIRRLSEDLGPVAFAGDGINDAPALAAAATGIALGTGTDIAIEAADVVLMSGDLSGVVNALAMSRRVMRNIRQNLFWAFAYNAALIPVAAGVLYPVSGLLLSPMLAAGAMALSSVFVVTNALRLNRVMPAIQDDTGARAPGRPASPTSQEARA